MKNPDELDIRHVEIKIKQHSTVTYLGCILENNLSGESVATKVWGKMNERLTFLTMQHFDYACSVWIICLIVRTIFQKNQTTCKSKYKLHMPHRSSDMGEKGL